jgi:hypothetical protein
MFYVLLQPQRFAASAACADTNAAESAVLAIGPNVGVRVNDRQTREVRDHRREP